MYLYVYVTRWLNYLNKHIHKYQPLSIYYHESLGRRNTYLQEKNNEIQNKITLMQLSYYPHVNFTCMLEMADMKREVFICSRHPIKTQHDDARCTQAIICSCSEVPKWLTLSGYT